MTLLHRAVNTSELTNLTNMVNPTGTTPVCDMKRAA
jgi:hypothetical protein